MFRNFTACPHCAAKGLPGQLWKIEERTPSITLSDGKSFHLILLSGPDLVPAPSGGLRANRLVGQELPQSRNFGKRLPKIVPTSSGQGRQGCPSSFACLCLKSS